MPAGYLHCVPFLNTFVREAVIEYSPLDKGAHTKAGKKLPALDEIEINELLAMPDKSKVLRSRPGGAEMLYATGCRVSELVGLTLERVDLSNRFVLLLGKGNKERVVLVNTMYDSS